MPITANNTHITFNNGSTQNSAYPVAADQNRIMRVYAGPPSGANTTGTWPKPTGLKGIKVTVVAGGGRGGRNPGLSPTAYSFGGGGGGGTAIKYYPAPSIPGPQPYTAGGSANSSSFGIPPLTVISATAGNTGSPIGLTGGIGGMGSGGDINIRGGNGARSANTFAGFCNGAVGGMSSLGGGGRPGAPGGNYGGGGGGADSVALPGAQQAGAGGVGVVVVEEYY